MLMSACFCLLYIFSLLILFPFYLLAGLSDADDSPMKSFFETLETKADTIPAATSTTTSTSATAFAVATPAPAGMHL